MKRIFLPILFALLSISVLTAQDYKHSFGIIAGSFSGISYKLHPYDNFAFQLDLGVSINQTPFGKATYRYGGYKLPISESAPVVNATYQINPNLMWQGELTDNFYCFLGGGVSAGFLWTKVDWVTHTGYSIKLENSSEAKYGVNALLGFEYCWSETPLTLGFDFRPGYGAEYDHVSRDISYHRQYFDWSLSLALRYNF